MQAPKAKPERDKSLIKDYLSGMSTVKLVSKYKISSVRIYFILGKNKVTKHLTR